MGLRAIGNAGHVSSAARLLNKCVNRNRNPMEVRVAAAQAFRRMPCDADVSGAPSFFNYLKPVLQMIFRLFFFC